MVTPPSQNQSELTSEHVEKAFNHSLGRDGNTTRSGPAEHPRKVQPRRTPKGLECALGTISEDAKNDAVRVNGGVTVCL